MRRLVRVSFLVLVLVLVIGSVYIYEDRPAEVEPTGVVKEEPGFEPVTLVAVGDVMLARKVNRLMAVQGDTYPFARLGEEFEDADITFGNLESPLSVRGKALPGKGICFRARPEMAGELARQGFDVLSIANNHALDYDATAFLDTRDALRGAGIKPVGGGANIGEARQLVVLERKGLRLGFLAYTDMADLFFHPQYPRRFRATPDLAGVAPLVEEDIKEDIAANRDKVDILIVSLHWGTEYSQVPTAEQRRMARELVDTGADIILGHHPHVLQGIEVYKDGLIAYSLGNFIFDQDHKLITRQGLMLKVQLSPQGVEEVVVYPIFIEQSQPRTVSGDQAQSILGQVVNLSADLGTILKIDGEKATTKPPVEPVPEARE